MKDTIHTCDFCGADLKKTWHDKTFLQLSHDVRQGVSYAEDTELQSDHDFCGMRCLISWIAERHAWTVEGKDCGGKTYFQYPPVAAELKT